PRAFTGTELPRRLKRSPHAPNGMPNRSARARRAANVAPTANGEFDTCRAIPPIATRLADQPTALAALLAQNAGYPGTRNEARVECNPGGREIENRRRTEVPPGPR